MTRSLLFVAILLAAATAAAAVPDGAATDAAANAANTTASARAAEASRELADLRRQMQELSRRMAKLSGELGEVGPRAYAYRYLGQTDRAMIGVVLAADAKGARISAVTPEGPAARAGLRDGDLIVAIDGTPLAGTTAAGMLGQARERLGNLKADDKVSIDYVRGAGKGAVAFVAERREAWNWPQVMLGDADHPLLPKDFEKQVRADVEAAMHDREQARGEIERAREAARRAGRDQDRAQLDTRRAQGDAERAQHDAQRALRRAMPWWGLNLAPVNAELGRYFGTDQGALVISTDEHALPGIRGGDVITRVAGEAVERPEDALRALRDQPSGQDVAITLLRERKVIALSVKTPEFKSIFSAPPPPPEPPEPPAPPSPQAAPAPPPEPAVPASPANAAVAAAVDLLKATARR